MSKPQNTPVRSLIRASAAILSAGVLLAACSSSSSKSGSSESGGAVSPSATTAPAAGGTGGVAVTVADTKGLRAPMTMTLATSTAPSGDVTFTVKNSGTVEHEVIVLKTDTAFDQLPIADAGDPPAPVKSGANKVDEASSVGETGDPNLKPGESRTFTVKGMTAGHYVLVCNIADHYRLGMRAAFTVS